MRTRARLVIPGGQGLGAHVDLKHFRHLKQPRERVVEPAGSAGIHHKGRLAVLQGLVMA